ncbi:MAG: class I SAM-dependent methyltransferase [Rhizobiaceae bacterium]
MNPQTPEQLLARAYALHDKDEAHSLYREWARSYDKTMLEGLGYLTPKKTAELLAGHVPDHKARILDVGCGTGLAGVELNRLGYRQPDGLDFSPEMLGVARSRSIYGHLLQADLNAPLELPDESYDALICTGTFTHAHVGASCLPELFRVLRREGLFAATVHKDVWESAGFSEMTEQLEKAGTMETVLRELGTYYRDSMEPEGYYLVWRKQ